MLPSPLHPAIVHFPIVLMILLPFVIAVVLWRLHDGARRRAWGLVALTAVLVTGSAWVALRTGEAEEDVVENVVAESAIHEHEEAAEQFLLVSWVVLGLAAAGFLPGRGGRGGRALTLVGSLALVYFGWRVGDLGGKLVYREGAAAAYVTATGSTAPRPLVHADDEHGGRSGAIEGDRGR
jgi:uncharacterized membrane protein